MDDGAAIKTATIVYARAHKVICPNCGADVDGWCGDPRGKEDTCEDCGIKYRIASDAEVKL